MAKFIVEIREVHVSSREVEASSAEEAIAKVKDGDGEEICCEYSHTLGDDTWSVTNADGDEVRPQYFNGMPGIPGS